MNKIKKVLIVDDNDFMRRKIKRVLSGFPCEFFEAEDGETALSQIEKMIFDVIFLDLQFPYGVTGIDILRKAKEIQSNLGKIIILTAWLDDRDLNEAKELGAFDFLGKSPVDRNKIIETFNRAIAK